MIATGIIIFLLIIYFINIRPRQLRWGATSTEVAFVLSGDVENIENRLTQQVRYLDKLVDELSKGRKMEKILRGS